MNFISEFEFINLHSLNLSSNNIKSQGALILSRCKFPNLEILNLDFNDIGDEGLKHLSLSKFKNIKNLSLSKNNISHKGISDMVNYAVFLNNLEILSLSENLKIKDNGILNMKNHSWPNLIKLILNYTSLTDKALNYLGETNMPKLKELYIQGNKFTENGKSLMDGLKSNDIEIFCNFDK